MVGAIFWRLNGLTKILMLLRHECNRDLLSMVSIASVV